MDSLIQSPKYKSASFIHILPFLFLYILLNHQPVVKKECKKCVVFDKSYNYIPDKTKKLPQNLKFYLLAIPVIILLLKSNDNSILEHSFVALSYAIGLKTLIHFMTPSLDKQEFTDVVMISLILNLIYFKIIPSDKISLGYLASALYSGLLLSLRQTTSANVLTDYIIAHFVFLYLKFF